MAIAVSPGSVLLCFRLSSLFNLSGVPNPLLPVTPIRTHTLVGGPSDGEDFTDSGEVERMGHMSYPYVVHACVNWYIFDLDSCVEITGFVYTSYS